MEVNGHAKNQVGALADITATGGYTGGVSTRCDAKGSAAQKRDDPINLPVSEDVTHHCTQPLKRRQDVHFIRHKHLSAVKVCIATIEIVVERIRCAGVERR